MMTHTGVPMPMVAKSRSRMPMIDGVGDQHSPVAKGAQEPRHDELHGHGSDGLRHDQQAGLNGCEAKPSW